MLSQIWRNTCVPHNKCQTRPAVSCNYAEEENSWRKVALLSPSYLISLIQLPKLAKEQPYHMSGLFLNNATSGLDPDRLDRSGIRSSQALGG